MTGLTRWALLGLSGLVGCGGESAVPDASPDARPEVDGGLPGPDAGPPCETEDPILLTPGSPANDEDPTAILAADGRLVVVHFAWREGNADLFATSSTDGQTWDPPTRITTHADNDFAPSLIQDDTGVYHVAWFRQGPAPGYFMHIRINSTLDPAVWDPADEVAATSSSGLIADWVPTLAQRPDGDLMIVFASAWRDATPAGPHDLYAITSPDGLAWSAPAPLAINDAVEHDHLPVLARTDQGMALAWVRHDESDPEPWENATSDVVVATSADGDTWSAPLDVTHDDAAGTVDVFPTIYRRHEGDWSLAWVTTALSPTGSVVDMPLATAGDYPAGLVELPLPGYSPRVTVTPWCTYLGVWVAGPVGMQEVYVRLFAR